MCVYIPEGSSGAIIFTRVLEITFPTDPPFFSVSFASRGVIVTTGEVSVSP